MNLAKEHRRLRKLERHKRKRAGRKGKARALFSGMDYVIYVEKMLAHLERVNPTPQSRMRRFLNELKSLSYSPISYWAA